MVVPVQLKVDQKLHAVVITVVPVVDASDVFIDASKKIHYIYVPVHFLEVVVVVEIVYFDPKVTMD